MQGVIAYCNSVKQSEIVGICDRKHWFFFSWNYCVNYRKIWWLSEDLVHD
jgi:hypothetical protein